MISSRYSEQGTVLSAIAEDAGMLADLVLLDGATNDRIQAQGGALAGISPYELVFGIASANIINAAFTHANPFGSRFSSATRGAWYCAEELDTSIAEVAYHRARRLGDIIVHEMPEQRPHQDTSTYDDWLADFRTELHALEPGEEYPDYLVPEPVPACYGASQALAAALLNERSNGLIYPSVRRKGYRCLACFRPALVYSVRRGERLELTLTALPGSGYSSEAHAVPL